MSYTVLARKYRSQTFDEVIGQDPITRTLRNAISQDRIHQGYLFCGTRGVGKTSMARILAKALNCLSGEGPTETPCGTCDSCVAVARGEDIDVIEIDGASNSGVDDVRELRSNAIYRPARSRLKIYIIDEVHMLSTPAFNALLKTLEEPPSHVKFIFATTVPQKVPATIMSRVQRFDFRPIPAGDIAKQLASICAQEAVEAEAAALKRLARLANGSMRDALSLLDQVLSMAGVNVTAETVNDLFPATHDKQFAALIDCLAASDASGALEIADQSLSGGHTLDYWCTLLIDQIRDLMVVRVCGSETDLVDVPAGLRAKLTEQARQFDSGAFVYMISVLEELRRSVKSSVSGRALVETTIIRLAEASKFSSIEALLERVGSGAQGGAAGSVREKRSSAGAATQAGAAPAARSAAKKNEGLTAPAVDEPSRGARTVAAEALLPAAGEASPTVQADRDAQAGDAALTRRRMTQADLKAAHAEPMVKAALETLGGQVVHVQRGAEVKAAPTQLAGSSAADSGPAEE